MKKIYFTVGPSHLFPTVNKHLITALKDDIPSLSHRSAHFKTIYASTTDALRSLLQIPATHHIFFTSCALEGMERIIANTVHKKSAHFVNGSFSREFYQTAVDLKKDAIRFDAPNGEGFDFRSITLPEDTETVCLVQNETSTGVATPLEDIYKLKTRYPSMLFAVDVVSSAPFVNPDFSKLDIVFFSVQKGFGLPAGLGVLIVNEKALKKAELLSKKDISIGSYHNFLKLSEFGSKSQTRETPNVLNIYLLGKVAEDMLSIGITNIRKDTEKKAARIYNFFDKKHRYKPYVKKEFRSQTTIVIDTKGESADVLIKLKEKGLILSSGYGKRKENHIRIANFPVHTSRHITTLLNTLITLNNKTSLAITKI